MHWSPVVPSALRLSGLQIHWERGLSDLSREHDAGTHLHSKVGLCPSFKNVEYMAWRQQGTHAWPPRGGRGMNSCRSFFSPLTYRDNGSWDQIQVINLGGKRLWSLNYPASCVPRPFSPSPSHECPLGFLVPSQDIECRQHTQHTLPLYEMQFRLPLSKTVR